MDEQTRLKEALGALLSLAEASGRRLTREQIWEACEDIGLNERQMEMVCAYLEMNHVAIEGFAAREADKALLREGETAASPRKKTGAEAAYFKMYVKELEGVPRYREDEEAALIAAMRQGDEAARERLVEGNLHRVVRLSGEYLGQGVLAADLVQEGNIALILAMDSYEENTNFTVHLLTEIERALVRAIEEQTGADNVGHCLAADANALLKATETLASKLGREATAEELAAHLHMSKRRVETLVKMSLDAMNLSEDSSWPES